MIWFKMNATVGACNSNFLPPFSLIRDFRKQNKRGNVSKISVNHTRHAIYGSVSLKIYRLHFHVWHDVYD